MKQTKNLTKKEKKQILKNKRPLKMCLRKVTGISRLNLNIINMITELPDSALLNNQHLVQKSLKWIFHAQNSHLCFVKSTLLKL